MWCWSANDARQLGREGEGGAAPLPVAGLPSVLDLRTGRAHACAQTTDGELWCWGDDAAGQLADGEVTAGGEATARRALRTIAGMP